MKKMLRQTDEGTKHNKYMKKMKGQTDEGIKEDQLETSEISLEGKLALQSIKSKIKKWKSCFPEETKIFKLKENATYEELKDLEKQIEFSVACSNGGAIIQSTVLGAAGIAEQFGPMYGLQLKGYQSVLATNESFRRTLLELECKYSDKMYTSIFGRLASTMIYSGTIVHFSNTQELLKNMNEKLEKNVPNNINDKYKEL